MLATQNNEAGKAATQNLAQLDTGESAAIVATETGFGNKETYRQAKFVAAHAEPETIARIDGPAFCMLHPGQ